MHKLRSFIGLALALSVLAGCKETVYSQLKEREANEIVAVLYTNGISSTKETVKGDMYTVSVPRAELGAAIAILTKAGLPRENYRSIGDVFPDDSVVGTPFEERARFSYALGEELSRTLSEIDGVHFARVHIVIPQKERFQETLDPSKASIAIYHRADFDPGVHVPQMKKLVTYAVPNLVYDNVSVSLFSAGALSDVMISKPAPAFAASAATFGGGDLTERHVGLLALFAAICVASVIFVVRMLMGARALLRRAFGHA